MSYICPYCLDAHEDSVEKCPNVNEPSSDQRMVIPIAYIQDYRKAPPFWLTTLGFSGHGKSTYIAMLLLLLEKLTGVMGEKFHFRALGTYTNDKILEEVRPIELDGSLPAKTVPSTVIPPLLMQVFNMPKIGSYCLVMYDVAGEIFNHRDKLDHWLPAIRQVRTLWFMVSLDDLLNDRGQRKHRINDLFNDYLNGMEALGANLRERNVIVVYTKADKLLRHLPPKIRDYLNATGDYVDPLSHLLNSQALTPEENPTAPEQLDVQKYWSQMDEISNELEQFTFNLVDTGGPAFIRSVKARGMNLVFSITSAIGQDPGNEGQIIERPRPQRVMDPFFWAIRLNKEPEKRKLCFIIDSGENSAEIFDNDHIIELWEMLKEYTDIVTYYLGRVKPVSYRNQTPPSKSTSVNYPPLIGPILNDLEYDTSVVIFSANEIIDLADYSKSNWRTNTVLVSINHDTKQAWSHKYVLRSDDDAVTLAQQIVRTLHLEESDL